MNFLRRNWYYLGGVLFVVLAIALVIFWNDMSMVRKLMWISFMALLVHQFEEYAWPGGFPAVMNIAWQPSGGRPDRSPLNRNTSLIVNVFIAYPFYILPIIFPTLIWLGLAQVFFGMAQFGVHGILINKKMHSLYNPGLFAVVFLHWPIGIYYIWYVTVNHLAGTGDFLIGVIACIAAAILMFLLPIRLMANKESKYPFAEEEVYGFAKAKIEKIRNS